MKRFVEKGKVVPCAHAAPTASSCRRLPVLSGERLVARLDLKADRRKGVLRVLSCRFEGTGSSRPSAVEDGKAAQSALDRYADALELQPTGWRLT